MKEMKGGDVFGGTSSAAAYSAVDSFYDKLTKLNQSSGLSLLFDFRQTSLNLYKFYEEVTLKGGYHQVTKDKRWGAVASSLNPEGSSLLPHQLQKIYENLLCPFEQIHHYRTSVKVPAKVCSISDTSMSSGDCLSCSARKRKHSPVSNNCYDDKQLSSAKKKCNANKSNKSPTGQRFIKEKSIGETSVEIEDIKSLEAPLKPRSAYQLFVKIECERLKKIHGESSQSMTWSIRDMALKAWRELPGEKRKPYIEESKKDKERFDRELKTYNDEKNNPVPKPRERPFCKEDLEKPVVSCSKMMWQITDGDYHVTMQPAPENIRVPKESESELAIQSMKNEPVNDTVFQINLEEYWSIDLPG